jgi:hypothetical protein
MLWLAILPVVTLLGLAVTHVVLLRFSDLRPYPAYGVAIAAWLAVQILVDIAATSVPGVPPWSRFGPTNVACYVVLAYCYFHFFNLGETGRRMRLLLELASAPQGLSEWELAKRYGAEEIVERRLNRLLQDGQVAEREGRVFVAGAALPLIAVIIAALRKVLIKETSPCD